MRITTKSHASALILMAALLLAACGGSGADDSTTTTAPAPTEADASSSTTTQPSPSGSSAEEMADNMAEDLEDMQASVGGGSATLTVGDQTWTFDSVLCAFGEEQTGQEGAEFNLSAIQNGLQLYASISTDPSRGAPLHGAVSAACSSASSSPQHRLRRSRHRRRAVCRR